MVGIFLLLFFPTVAQGIRAISGKIVNDSLEKSSIHIVNLSLKTGTITGEDGSFVIMGRENDTLLFSSVQYISKKKIISAAVFNGSPLIVELERAVNKLEEVNISNISLSGNVHRDLANIKTFNKYNLGIELSKEPPPTQAERRIMVAPVRIIPLGGAVNLDHLINVLSGRHALNKKAKANQDLAYLVEEARNMFSKEFFVQQLSLPSEELIVFLFYCAENKNLKQHMETKNKLELMEFYKKQVPEFSDHRQLE